MNLANAMPAVCSAIGSNKFEQIAEVRSINRTGPANGANVYFEFGLAAGPLPMQQERVPANGPVRTSAPARAEGELDLSDAVVLISCVKSKRARSAPARSLYTSAWFHKARDLVEASGARWFVLSSRYGLVVPGTEIAPYDYTLNTLGVDERRLWAAKVLDKLVPEIHHERRVVMFAGARYREFLIEPLERLGMEVVVPMAHLRRGEQLGWLTETRMSRLSDLVRFYALLDRLKQRLGGTRTLASFEGLRDWPERGVYFFFEPTEARNESGVGPRVVRVGTHALGTGSRSTLRQRLGQHRGGNTGGGNHRGSIFRLLIGQALLAQGGLPSCPSWGVKSDAAKACEALGIDRQTLIAAEAPVEQAVSRHIGAMPFLWLDIDDQPGPHSRAVSIEGNAIALLSNHARTPLDPASPGWLGHSSDRPRVRSSGLWNQQHVEETHDPPFSMPWGERSTGSGAEIDPVQ